STLFHDSTGRWSRGPMGATKSRQHERPPKLTLGVAGSQEYTSGDSDEPGVSSLRKPSPLIELAREWARRCSCHALDLGGQSSKPCHRFAPEMKAATRGRFGGSPSRSHWSKNSSCVASSPFRPSGPKSTSPNAGIHGMWYQGPITRRASFARGPRRKPA